MEKIEIDVIKALAKGAVNMYKLNDEKNHIAVVAHDKGFAIIPIIDKVAYINIEDEKSSNIVEEIMNAVIKNRCYNNSNIIGAKIKYKKAPAHNMVIKGDFPTKGAKKYSGADAILEEAGYTFESTTRAIKVESKDYSELLKNPSAKAIYDENKEVLKAVGATFSSLNTETKIAYEGLTKGNYLGLILAGPTGTGKSWAGRIIADKMGAPYLTLQIDRGTTTDSLVGSFVPKAGEKVDADQAAKILEILRNPDLSIEESLQQIQNFLKITGDSAKWEFVAGPLLKAFSEGWVIILEEVNFGDPGVLAKLNEFTDGTLRVTVNGVSYKKHPNFLAIMTMNPGYAGTDPLNIALKNRFAKVNVPQLTKDQFCDRMIAYSNSLGHGLSREFFEKLFDFAGKMEALGNDTMFHEDVKYSIRNAQRLCDCILTEKRNADEFAAAIAIQYINDLTMDNDNSDAVEKLKTDSATINDIAQLYDLYDYAEIAITKETPDLDSFYSVKEEKDEVKDEIMDENDLDELLGKV